MIVMEVLLEYVASFQKQFTSKSSLPAAVTLSQVTDWFHQTALSHD